VGSKYNDAVHRVAPFRGADHIVVDGPTQWAETREVPAGRLPARSLPCPESLMAPPGPRHTLAFYRAMLAASVAPAAPADSGGP
jgi:hypothetical protein